MKKVILTLAFIAGITTMNANTQFNDPGYDCHIEACAFLGFAEELQEVDGELADLLYDLAFNECMS